MSRIAAHIVYYIDRLFPRVRVGGRESERAYSDWEYEVGKGLLAEYADHFGSLDGRMVLDIGCGLGGKTVAYAEAGAAVVGVDIEQKNISQSLCFARSMGAEAAFIVGDAEVLPFAEGTFDLVVANDSMEHFQSPEKALPELARVLRPGGSIFLFFTPWGSPLGSHLYDYVKTPWCHLIFPGRLLRELLGIILEKRGAPDPSGEADSLMGQFRNELNRITIARYNRIRRATAGVDTVFEEHKPPRFSFLGPLTRVPFLKELFTGTVVAFLCKKKQ